MNTWPPSKEIVCARCGKRPHEIGEYNHIWGSAQLLDFFGHNDPEKLTPEQVDTICQHEEGTFNPETNRFFCTSCYIKVGQPLGKAP